MGIQISSFYQTADISKTTQNAMLALLRYIEEKKTSGIEWSYIEQYISNIPKEENILSILSEEGYNLLQQAIKVNCVELVKWILDRGCDVNEGPCSLPLHIAIKYGSEEIVELLLKHGASVDIKARLCLPGPHQESCELNPWKDPENCSQISVQLLSAEEYAIYNNNLEVLKLLLTQKNPSRQRPLLDLALELEDWNCTRLLVDERPDEINQCYKGKYPIHTAAILDRKFLELFLEHGADVLVKTASGQETVLHVVLLSGHKSGKETFQDLKMLLNHGCRKIINEPDSRGFTPLHALIARYIGEESSLQSRPSTWDKWDMLRFVGYLLQNGAQPSINHKGNSALALVLQHVRDWEFNYELLEIFLENGGDPNNVGRYGSTPLMVCLESLITKDPCRFLSQTRKLFYLNTVKILCEYGANPNCSSRGNLTPMHALVFFACDHILSKEEHRNREFAFIGKLLSILLKHGLDPNVQYKKCKHTARGFPALVNMSRNELEQNITLSELYAQLRYELPQDNYMNQHKIDPNIHLYQLYEHIHHTIIDMAV